jgi:hypothetical protein
VTKNRLAYAGICFVAFLLSIIAPKLWWLWLTIGGFAIHGVKPHSPVELNTRKSAVGVAQRGYDAALAEYDRVRGDRRLADAFRSLGQLKAQLDDLPQVLAREMKQLQATLVARQLHDFLDRHFTRTRQAR